MDNEINCELSGLVVPPPPPPFPSPPDLLISCSARTVTAPSRPANQLQCQDSHCPLPCTCTLLFFSAELCSPSPPPPSSWPANQLQRQDNYSPLTCACTLMFFLAHVPPPRPHHLMLCSRPSFTPRTRLELERIGKGWYSK